MKAWKEVTELVSALRTPTGDNSLLRNVLWARVHGLHRGVVCEFRTEEW